MKWPPCSPYPATWQMPWHQARSCSVAKSRQLATLPLVRRQRDQWGQARQWLLLPAVGFLTWAYTARSLLLVSGSNSESHGSWYSATARACHRSCFASQFSEKTFLCMSASLNSHARIWPITRFCLCQLTKANNSHKQQCFKNHGKNIHSYT